MTVGVEEEPNRSPPVRVASQSEVDGKSDDTAERVKKTPHFHAGVVLDHFAGCFFDFHILLLTHAHLSHFSIHHFY